MGVATWVCNAEIRRGKPLDRFAALATKHGQLLHAKRKPQVVFVLGFNVAVRPTPG